MVAYELYLCIGGREWIMVHKIVGLLVYLVVKFALIASPVSYLNLSLELPIVDLS